MKTEEIKKLLIDCANFIQPYDDGGKIAVTSIMERIDKTLKELSEPKERPTTEVIETENGHCVKFSIGCQSFKMEERPGLKGEITSFDHAKWYEKQLNTAFDTLLS